MKRVCIDFNSWYNFTDVVFKNESVDYNKDINRVVIDNVKEVILEHGYIIIYYIIKPNYKMRHKTYPFDIANIKTMTIN